MEHPETELILEGYLKQMQHHLYHELLPYWRVRGVDDQFGGFLTYYDRNGLPTGETVKTLLCQARMIYAFSLAARTGHDDGYFLKQALQGMEFVNTNFWDPANGGWFWTANRDGTPLDRKKIIYGLSFIVYSYSELYRACGNHSALDWAFRTFHLLQEKARDTANGGYWEFFEEDWQPTKPGVYGGDRKSMDVHMHLMEAFTNLYAASGDASVKQAAIEVTELITSKMLHPETGTGIAQFSGNFAPQRAIIFKNVWGSDRDVDDQEGRPLDNTSYGHNVEFGWLLNVTVKVLGMNHNSYAPVIRRLYDQCLDYGIDWSRGGVYCEGPHAGTAREKNKEFWQQAEALIAMLDGMQTFGLDAGNGEYTYLDAYHNLHTFVFDHVINHEVGEWFALLDEMNNVLWDYMGHAWKINYHTLRSVIECEQRLKLLLGR